ncbi:DUF2262 domain-containing protein [Persicirhabdus sediminis]|uniref:DUF2262 domain-containing protein n=1 Tax=Persicirhabdus sediminis TaxID=454144 RepID=A0A8J7MGV8_9BACT|nr:DUF2262 domain-containing protein [Persicirhabdus sediminis]MBK1792578.1 DUF2262 domain-containing protein [Persicirhabdus sediminis]
MSELTPFLQEEKRKSEEDLQRQRDLCAELAEQPKQVINGLVSPSGAWSSNPRSLLDHWSFLFSLDAWTDAEGALHTDKMTIRKVVDGDELQRLEESINAESIISIALHIGQLEGFDCRQGALVEIVESGVDDEDLKRFAADLATPVTVDSRGLGRFTLDRRVGWFEGEARWGLRKIRLNLTPTDVSDPSGVIGRAEELWGQRKTLTRQACEVAASTLLEVKNASWLNEGEQPMSKDKFMRKMKLESITVEEDGSFDFWFEDGDIFWGHSIEVRGDPERGFFDAGFHG